MLRYCLKTLRRIAVSVQLGNPALRAPVLLLEPGEQEKMPALPVLAENNFVWQLKKAICSGLYGGAIINEQNQVYSRFIVFPWGKELHPSLSLPFLGRKVASLEKAIFLITPDAKGNYYHWVTELLPRLLLIMKSGLPDFEERKLILHYPSRRYERDILSLLGIPEDRILRLKNFETAAVQDLVVADSIRLGRTFPEWKRALLQALKKKLIPAEEENRPGTKIYLRRGNQAKRCLIGEEGLVRLLRKMGFDILDPEQMSFKEQMSALAGARLVVGLHGAALTNIIFCRAGTRIVELRSQEKAPEHYVEIAKTCKLHFDSINLPPEKKHEKGHRANKQNLLLTEESLNHLLEKVKSYDGSGTKEKLTGFKPLQV